MAIQSETIALAIEARNNATAALSKAAADVRKVGSAAAEASAQATATSRTHATAALQQGRMVLDMEHAQMTAARQTAAERAAHMARERAGINESIQLLALKARTVDVTSKQAVADLRENIAIEQMHLQSVKATEAQYLKLGLVLQGLDKRVDSYAVAQARAAAATSAMSSASNLATANVDKIHVRARTGANAVTQLAFAATTSGGSMTSMALAAGTAAEAIATLTRNARIMALASGIGAGIVAIAAGVGLLAMQIRKLRAEAPEGVLSALVGQHITHLKTLDEVDAEIARRYERHRQLTAGIKDRPGLISSGADTETSQAAQNEMAAVSALQVGRIEIIRDAREKERAEAEAARDKALAEERAAMEKARDIRAQIRRDEYAAMVELDATTLRRREETELARLEAERRGIEARRISKTEEADLIRQAEAASAERIIALRTQTARDTLEADFAARRHEIENLKIIEAEKTELLKELERLRQSELAVIRAEAQESMRVERASDVEDARNTSAKRRAILAKETVQSLKMQLEAGKSLAQALLVTAVSPIVTRLQAKAVSEAVEAAASAASLDFIGAARHAAVAALATAAAHQVQSLAGGAAGGGSSVGGGAGGGGNATTFEPTAQGEGRGNVVINLITRDPYGREGIAQTIYEINRANGNKRPIPIAPTTGLTPLPAGT